MTQLSIGRKILHDALSIPTAPFAEHLAIDYIERFCSRWKTVLPRRDAAGNVLVRVFLGRDGQEVDDTQSDDALIQAARNEVHTVLGASTDPVFARLFRDPQAMPQYTLGHLDRLAQIDRALEATPGVFLAGNSYRGAGIPDCIRSGQQAASNTLRYLEGVID